jgi:preprotein translocase subunit SecG
LDPSVQKEATSDLVSNKILMILSTLFCATVIVLSIAFSKLSAPNTFKVRVVV